MAVYSGCLFIAFTAVVFSNKKVWGKLSDLDSQGQNMFPHCILYFLFPCLLSLTYIYNEIKWIPDKTLKFEFFIIILLSSPLG